MERINVGNQNNDGTGDSIRDAFKKVNANFQELYGINNLGDGLFFTKLKDTPKYLKASSTSTATIIAVDNFGNTLTQKSLIAGEGIVITNTSTITISNPSNNLSKDLFPQLGGNLNGNQFRATNFGDPIGDQDLVTKAYADSNGFVSKVNLYVSTYGNDSFGPSIPASKQGRAYAYAYGSLNKACEVAEGILSTSTVELGPYQQNITINVGAFTATVDSIVASPIAGAIRVKVDLQGYGSGTDQFQDKDMRPGQYIRGVQSDTIAFVYAVGLDGAGDEFYDVTISSNPTGSGFYPTEGLQYSTNIPKKQITIHVESGIYYEQLPIRVPANVSIRGDEFRRVIIRPASGTSASKWANIYFRRDDSFDGLVRTSNNNHTGLAPVGQKFGYHYLTDPTDITSTPRLNEDMDMFLMNDATILRAISGQGHGGFMCVLDPEGQILTKSPYMQNCSSFSRSLNKQSFSGGIFADGFAGNLKATVSDASTYFTGTLTISVVSNTLKRTIQTPTAVYYLGNRYEVAYVFTATTATSLLYLNPRNAGGIAYTNGQIPIWPSYGTSAGNGYSVAPTVIFSQPQEGGGYAAKGTASLNAAGTVTSITITNPGSGYSGTVTVSFIGGLGAGALTPATTITLPGSAVQTGFIGQLPSEIEIGTAGNKSMLSADFTQINDMGYGIVCTNNGLQESVSMFTYYCYSAYYSVNGGQMRSLNGSCAYGENALKAEGADPNEIPIPIYLTTDMVQTATMVSYNWSTLGGLNTVNTGGSTILYIRDLTSIYGSSTGKGFNPYNQSIIEIDHGYALDIFGNYIGLQYYDVISASTVSNALISGLVQLNLSTTAAFGLATGGIKTAVSSGTQIVIRSGKVHQFTGVNAATIVRPSTALQFSESTATTYRVLAYDNTNVPIGDNKTTLRETFDYVALQTYSGVWPAPTPGATTIKVVDVNTATALRMTGATASTSTQLVFGWKGGLHRITNYQTSASLGQAYAQITISPGLVDTLTNVYNTSTAITLYAGLRAITNGEITTRISTMRATGHDMLNIGAGSFEASNYPNDIFGPGRQGGANASKERIEIGKGRVFAVTSDQDGNFKVGDFFQVDQGTGGLTLAGNLSLSKVEGLGFVRGYVAKEFSLDSDMLNERTDTVPMEQAVVQYVNKRLGVTRSGSVLASKLGSGYLDLNGLQSMTGNLQMAGYQINMSSAKILNLTTATTLLDAANKGYVDLYADTRLALKGMDYADPVSATARSQMGKLTGQIELHRDPLWYDGATVPATKRYVDQTRQFARLTDVNLNFTASNAVDLLIFGDTTYTVNTSTTSTSALAWTATRQIINAKNTSTSNILITTSTIYRNTYQMMIAASTISDYHIASTASIQQSKLAMATAGTRSSDNGWVGIGQANIGLAAFADRYFVSTSGFVTLANTTSFMVIADSAKRIAGSINAGTYIVTATTAPPSQTIFDGSTSTTWRVDATSSNTADKIVARDASGNFAAGTITAGLAGTAACANCLLANGTFLTATTVACNNTIVARDGSGNIKGNCYIGTATCAFYADLAESYQADALYRPCTVLQFGGSCEVTVAQTGTRAVAGVVSTNPAYHMNSALQGENVVALALQGRVPTKVKGPVQKGDMMVSAGDGYARSDPDPKIGTVIGKALEDFDGEEGVIEIVVGRL